MNVSQRETKVGGGRSGSGRHMTQDVHEDAADMCRLWVVRMLEAGNSSEKEADLGRLDGVGTFARVYGP